MTKDQVIRGARVVLRPLTPEDLPLLGTMVQRPGVAEWWPDHDEQRLREDLYGPKSDDVTAFAMEFEGNVVGLIWYYEEDDPQYRMAGIDLFVDCDWHGRGLGADALRTLVKHLFEERRHHRVVIDPALANKRAIHVYEKVGFQPVGVMRRYERLSDGGFRDGLLMDMLPEDLSEPEPPGPGARTEPEQASPAA